MGQHIRNNQLERVMQEERSRGTQTRLPDETAVEEGKLLLADMRQLLQSEDRQAFRKALTVDYGIAVGSEPYRQAIKVWDEEQKEKRHR